MCACARACVCVCVSVATILLKVYHDNICYLDMYHDTSRYQHIAKQVESELSERNIT